MSARPNPKPAGKPWDLHNSVTTDQDRTSRKQQAAKAKGGKR
jgi:hypothetical protein